MCLLRWTETCDCSLHKPRPIGAGFVRNARTLLLILSLLGSPMAFPGFVNALECGDLNGDCSVTATDALQLLRHAVGLNQPLLCNCDENPGICETDQAVFGIDCFGDEPCAEVDLTKPYCDGGTCSECSENAQCGEGKECDHKLERCMRTCAYQ